KSRGESALSSTPRENSSVWRWAPWPSLSRVLRSTPRQRARSCAPMITAIVQYRLPPNIDLEACAEHFRKIAPGFRTVPGLIRKQFIYAEAGWAGRVYLWQPRAGAQA